jgi:hypothetical protein
MRPCETRILEEIRRLAEHNLQVLEKVARLDERMEVLESALGRFLRDHNDLVALKTQWKFVAGLAAFLGSALTTIVIFYLRQ